MKKNKTFVVTVISVHLLTACSGSKVAGLFAKPYMLDTNPPEGPENYQQGWKDGCQSGMASNNTNFNMTIGSQRFTINSWLQGDQLYNIAWQYAYNHCGYSMKALTQYSL
jgi:hypothetical protein